MTIYKVEVWDKGKCILIIHHAASNKLHAINMTLVSLADQISSTIENIYELTFKVDTVPTAVINSKEHTISKIKRKSDSKEFACYYRNGRVGVGKLEGFSYWINDDGEELCLDYINLDDYEVIKMVKI